MTRPSAVLDTCALLEWVLCARTLPLPAPYLISAVSWCEIAWKHRRGQLPLPDPLDEWMAQADHLPLTTVAVDKAQFLTAVTLNWDHRDPADRIIVALAQQRRLPLITSDQAISGFLPGCRW